MLVVTALERLKGREETSMAVLTMCATGNEREIAKKRTCGGVAAVPTGGEVAVAVGTEEVSATTVESGIGVAPIPRSRDATETKEGDEDAAEALEETVSERSKGRADANGTAVPAGRMVYGRKSQISASDQKRLNCIQRLRLKPLIGLRL